MAFHPQIALPATDADVLAQVINPALADLKPALATNEARALLLAIGRQESGFAMRTQIAGPARGLWQFEVGGVTGVMRHPASQHQMQEWCELHAVGFAPSLIYRALANNDVFAAGVARLLLWTDPRPLPALGQGALAWDVYERAWRPGKPDFTRWRQTAYPQAIATLERAA